jgi:hypothetical protein
MPNLAWIALAVVLISSGGMVLRRRWRWNIGFLAALYLAVFGLLQSELSIAMAAVKLVAGWMSCVILFLANLNTEDANFPENSSWVQGRLFRAATIGVVIAISFIGAIGLSAWLGMQLPITWAGLLLIGMGLLHLGISTQPFRVILGLLTALAGFEIVYAAVESSALVAGLLVVINLGLALGGAYFLSLPSMEESQ